MQLYVETLAALILALSSSFIESKLIQFGKKFGSGPGVAFSDADRATPVLNDTSIFVSGDNDRVKLVFVTFSDQHRNSIHGELYGTITPMQLEADEYVNKIICNSNGLVIRYLNMTTNKGRSVAAGYKPTIIDPMIDVAGPFYQLGGFAGTQQGGVITSLQAIWSCKQPTCPD